MRGLKAFEIEEIEWAKTKKLEGPDEGCMLGYMDRVEILHQEQQQVRMENMCTVLAELELNTPCCLGKKRCDLIHSLKFVEDNYVSKAIVKAP